MQSAAANRNDCRPRAPTGVGLGLRWDFLEEVLEGPKLALAFFEVSPENYMRRGGYYPAALERVCERYPIVTHGLTLSLGGADELDRAYLSNLKTEIERLATPWHSDHLCFSSAGGRMLHELLPLKWSSQNVDRVVDRLRETEDALGVPMAIENISAYALAGRPHMPEAEFIARILDRSQAWLLLDVNNVYVNSQNFDFDPYAFLNALPLERVIEIHVAGHSRTDTGLLIDSHGSEVCDPVLKLLEWAIERTGPVPVLLERDNAVPPLTELLAELDVLKGVYGRALAKRGELHAVGA